MGHFQTGKESAGIREHLQQWDHDRGEASGSDRQPAGQHRYSGISAGDAIDALSEQVMDRVQDLPLLARIFDASSQSFGKTHLRIDTFQNRI
jgi:hypothetical protein